MRVLTRAIAGTVVLAALAATPTQAAPWKLISGGTDTVLTDVQQSVDGVRHAIFLEHRGSGGTAAYDVVDRELSSSGALAGKLPVVSNMSAVLGARVLPTRRGLVALVSGRVTANDRTALSGFLSPLGGGAWSPINAPDIHRFGDDTFFAEIAQQYTGVSAAKITGGPPYAALPDGSFLVTTVPNVDRITIRRVLAGNSAEGTIELPDSFGDCRVGHAVPAADAAGRAYVIYDIGRPTDATKPGCADAFLRQELDPTTLALIGAPVAYTVPASVGGAPVLRVNPLSIFGSSAVVDVVPGPDGRPLALHSLRILNKGARKVKPSDQGYPLYSHTELAIWDADGKFRRVPVVRPRGAEADSQVESGSPQPILRAFPNGDIVLAYASSSSRLIKKACVYWRKFYNRLRTGRGPQPTAREQRRCRYFLFPPAIVIGRLHAGRWKFQELEGPGFNRRKEFFAAMRILATSSSDVTLAVEADVFASSGKPSATDIFKTKGAVYLRKVKF